MSPQDITYTRHIPISTRKRNRDADDEPSSQGFGEHRTKRRVASLAFRQSPELKRRYFSSYASQESNPQSPTVADITPVGSDSEDQPNIQTQDLPGFSKYGEPKSYFSPWSSSPDCSLPSTQRSPCPGSSQPSVQMEDVAVYSDDLEMTDTSLLYPGPFQADPSASINGRIPTPIHTQFSSQIRSTNRAPAYFEPGVYLSQDSDDGMMTDRMKNNRRLPSPISEGETSPRLVGERQDEMMEVEILDRREGTSKKGHTRSRTSIRSWSGTGTETHGKRFSMGYRSDCEKCQKRVPGHFSHIITY